MNTLITYDVTRRHSEVKKAMRGLDYFDYWTSNGKACNLPNTTLWKINTTPKEALEAIKNVVSNLNYGQTANNQIRLERCVSVSFDSWDAIAGDKHSD